MSTRSVSHGRATSSPPSPTQASEALNANSNDARATTPAAKLPAVPVAARRRAQRLARHPLLASALAAGDSRLDFEAFADALLADLAPVGPLETTLAARIAGLAWRLNRAQALESGFLSKPDAYGAHLTPIENALDNRNDLAALEAMQRWETSLARNLARAMADLRALKASRRSAVSEPSDAQCALAPVCDSIEAAL